MIPPFFKRTGTLFLFAGILASCSTTAPWLIEETNVSSSREKTTPDAILVCWEKPVEKYSVLSELKIDITQEESEDKQSLAEIVLFMKEKAANKGANALLLRHREHSALYKANRLNTQSFIQQDKQTGQLFLESKAIWIEETQSSHGGDEAGSDSLPIKEYKKYY